MTNNYSWIENKAEKIKQSKISSQNEFRSENIKTINAIFDFLNDQYFQVYENKKRSRLNTSILKTIHGKVAKN